MIFFLVIFIFTKQTAKTRKTRQLIPKYIIIVSDASIRNDIVISIAHIYSYSNIVKKTLYYTANVTLTKAELFAIKYGINQAIQVLDVSYIIIITNAIYVAQHIFDSTIHSY